MKRDRRIGAALAACVLLTGLFLFVTADDTATAGPALHVPPTASVGIPFVGDASCNGDVVEVEVFLDGVPVPGLMDDIMDGSVNAFDFMIPESCRGHDIEVVATTLDGRETRQMVRVN